MAKIPLRAYLKEIENQIERGEIEQAVAHGKNILKSYPKHIDTYRLLGKAFLESQRYSEAADILQRVLSVIPDDFVSQIGMSIIREDEGNLDAAIWHMERAYEVQPFNPAVQEELRRLYGRRDGVEPPKIRLTRGALVRLYTRGELYPQAVAETRAALAEDPQRLDLRVLLARLNYLAGHKNDAAEVCSELIRQLPYCYEANRLLAEILPTTSRADEARKFQQRIYALDPYEAFLSPVAPTSDLVPDQAVMIEQFIWDAAEQGAQAPEWTRNIGVQWEETEEENLPDWLNTLKPETASGAQPEAPVLDVTSDDNHNTDAAPLFAILEGPADEPSNMGQGTPKDEQVPDWLKDAGWSATDKSADEIMALQEESPEEEIIPAEIPDWLQSIAPQGETLSVDDPEDSSGWLDNLLQEPAKGATQQPDPFSPFSPASTQPEGEAESLGWLDDLTDEPQSTMIETGDTQEQETSQPNDLPDWLSNIQTGQSDEQPLETAAPLPPEASTVWPANGNKPAEEDTPELSNEVPAWLNSLDTDLPEPTSAPADLPDWLNAITEEPGDTGAQPVQPEENGIYAAGSTEAMPEWLTQLQNNPDPDSVAPPEPGESMPASEASSLPVDRSDEDSTMAWLQSLAPQPESVEEPAVATGAGAIEPAAEEAVIDPMQSPVSQYTPEDVLAEKDTRTAAGQLTADEPAAETPSPDFSDMDAAMAWLESLAAKQGADEATLITPADQRTDTPPEWVLNEIGQPPAGATDITPEETDTLAIAQEAAVDEATVVPVVDEATAVDEVTSALITPVSEVADEPVAGAPEPEEMSLAELDLETSRPEQPAGVAEAETGSTENLPAEMDMDATFAWLESLAAKQGADEATLLTAPDDRSETPPEWIQHQQETVTPVQPEQTGDLEIPAPPASLEDASTGSINQPATQAAADDLSDWLLSLEEEPSVPGPEGLENIFADPLAGQTSPADEQAENPEIEENTEINPETWLSASETAGPERDADENKFLPDWLKNPLAAELPTQPVPPENMPAWLFGIGESKDSDPSSPDEEKPVAPNEYHSEWEPEEKVPTSIQQPPPEPAPAEEIAEYPDLSVLQKALASGDLDHALAGYNQMINEGIHLDETIKDLREALYRYPVDIAIWQVLGDAYARNNQLQEALDAYTKAEELLR